METVARQRLAKDYADLWTLPAAELACRDNGADAVISKGKEHASSHSSVADEPARLARARTGQKSSIFFFRISPEY